jgi:hypothetical protein
VELFDLSLWAVPIGIALAVVALVWRRWVLPLFGAVVGVPIGGVVGRYAWEWFADRPPWLDFGSEFEGLDWVIGFASGRRTGGRTHRAWRFGVASKSCPSMTTWPGSPTRSNVFAPARSATHRIRSTRCRLRGWGL